MSKLFWNKSIVSGSKLFGNSSGPMKWARETLISQWNLFSCSFSACYVAFDNVTTLDININEHFTCWHEFPSLAQLMVHHVWICSKKENTMVLPIFILFTIVFVSNSITMHCIETTVSEPNWSRRLSREIISRDFFSKIFLEIQTQILICKNTFINHRIEHGFLWKHVWFQVPTKILRVNY